MWFGSARRQSAMKTKYPKLAAGLVLLLSVFSDGIEHGTSAEDARWTLRPSPSSGALTSSRSCSTVTMACVRLNQMMVKKTGSDPGSMEEWHLHFTVSKINYSKWKQVDVPEKLSNARVMRFLTFDWACVPSAHSEFIVRLGGHEDDDTSFDDPIPTVTILTQNACATGELTSFPAGAVDHQIICKESSDHAREACYYFDGEYR
jgi:hypothetical protein